MTERTLSLALALFLSACASSGNPVREAAASGELLKMTLAPGNGFVPMLPAAELDGVWLDSDDKALAWVKTVEGEVRIFVQDSLEYQTVVNEQSVERLMAAADGGKAARGLAKDWPYRDDPAQDAKRSLSVVVAAKPMPAAAGAPTASLNGPWAYAHSCHGEPAHGAGHESFIANQRTPGGLNILYVRFWHTPSTEPGAKDLNLRIPAMSITRSGRSRSPIPAMPITPREPRSVTG